MPLKGKMCTAYFKAYVIFYDWRTTVKQIESMSHTVYLFRLSPLRHCSRSLCVSFEKPTRFARSLYVSVDMCESWYNGEKLTLYN